MYLGGEVMYDGGETTNVDRDRVKSKSLWCNHDDEEPCTASCTFQRFPKDKANTKA